MRKGTHQSPEAKEKIRAANEKRFSNPEERAKISESLKGEKNPNYGTHHTPEWKAMMSEKAKERLSDPETRALLSRKRKPLSPEHKAKLSVIGKQRQTSAETRAKMSTSRRGKSKDEQWIAKMAVGIKEYYAKSPAAKLEIAERMKGNKNGVGRIVTDEEREKLRRRWANPEYKDRVVRAIIRASSRRPTTPEKVVIEMLKEILPNQYQYVGSGHETVINGCNPDFININGQKKVIEVFGDWYHCERKTGKPREQEEVDKINTYREFGFDCLIIWEYDTKKHKDEVAKRILAFHRQKHKKPEIQPQLL